MNDSTFAEGYNDLARVAARRMFPGVDLDAMELGFNLIRAANKLQQDLENHVHRPAGVTWAAFRVLFTIGVSGEISPHQIARLSSISPASATSVLNTLEKYGYIHRVPHSEDGRSKVCTLTERGAEVVAQLFERNNHREAEWRAALTDHELRETAHGLKKLIAYHPADPDPDQATAWEKIR
ncbi:MarR family winged helix-turn-helix transcriptional regulator [Subtercola sp. YIM 133946]|uniref:MarR family winged helix-turn-helix transcriptional regulator n=1 Tax=Subtercola sp. YIM 133946 TaxID=3118909 RepID=UPI002F94B576